jgi:hypothetical protein
MFENNDTLMESSSLQGQNIEFFQDNKMKLKSIIQKWVINDNEMRTINEQLLKKKKLNKELTEELLFIIKELEIETVDIKDGYISYVKKNQKKGISNKLLKSIFTKYYNGDTNEIERINDFIEENREITVKEYIVRKIK